MADISDKARQTGKARERHNAAFVVGSVVGGVVGAATALWKAPQTGEELRRKLTSGGDGEAPSGRVVSSVRTGSGRALGGARAGSDRLVSIAKAGSGRLSRSDSTTSDAPAAGDASTTSFADRVLERARAGSDRLVGIAKAGSARLSRSDSTANDAPAAGATSTASFSSRVLSFVEKAAAPIVGVKLGQTANGSGPDAGGSSARISPIRDTDAAPTTTTTTTAEHTVQEDGLDGQDRLRFGTYSGRANAAPSSGTAPTIASGFAAEPAETPADATVGQTEIAGGTPSTSDQGEISATATPSPASSDIPEGVPGHVPTTEELVTPATPFVPQANTAQQSPGTSNLFPEPDSDGTERT